MPPPSPAACIASTRSKRSPSRGSIGTVSPVTISTWMRGWAAAKPASSGGTSRVP
jgi:hypothetical protein